MSDLISEKQRAEFEAKLIQLKSIYRARHRVKGEWLKGPDDMTKCSDCGFILEDWIQGAFYNYCPNCGANMRGE